MQPPRAGSVRLGRWSRQSTVSDGVDELGAAGALSRRRRGPRARCLQTVVPDQDTSRAGPSTSSVPRTRPCASRGGLQAVHQPCHQTQREYKVQRLRHTVTFSALLLEE